MLRVSTTLSGCSPPRVLIGWENIVVVCYVLRVAGACQQQFDVGVGGGGGSDVVAAVEMLNAVNVQVLCCPCTVTLECDDELSCLILAAHRHARL